MIKAYTDGSSSNKTKCGGWAFVVTRSNKKFSTIIYEESGGAVDTSNNQMEMEALMNCILYLSNNFSKEKISIFSDSKHCVDGINKFLSGWKKNGWKNSSGREIKNVQHWKIMHSILESLTKKDNKITVSWVKGHAGNKGNEIADLLCGTERKRIELAL